MIILYWVIWFEQISNRHGALYESVPTRMEWWNRMLECTYFEHNKLSIRQEGLRGKESREGEERGMDLWLEMHE